MNKKYLLISLITFCNIAIAEEDITSEEKVIEKKINKKEILLGSSLHYKLDVDEENGEYLRGITSCFKDAEESDKYSFIPKHKFYENGFKASRDLDNSKKLIYMDKVSALFAYSNSEGLAKSMKLIEDQNSNMAIFFPNLSYSEVDHKIGGIFHIRPAVEKELMEIVNYIKEIKEKKIAIIYEEGSEWQKEYITKNIPNIKENIIEEKYSIDPLKMNHVLLSLKEKEPDYIIGLGYSHALISFIKRSMVTSLAKTIFILPFYVLGSDLIESLESLNPSVVVCKAFPNLDSKDEIVRDYLRYAKKYNPEHKVGISGLEGFISARTMLEFIDSLKDEDKTSEGIYKNGKGKDFNKYIDLRMEEISFTDIE